MASFADSPIYEQDEHNAIDFIMQRVTLILLRKQEVSFDKLRKLTLLGSTPKNYKVYCEIVVLSFIKYLDLDSAFKQEINENTEAYRIFNALNLNDDRINKFFVEFIAVLVPEIPSALSTVLSQLASRLASQNQTRYTNERILRLEAKLNDMIKDGIEEAQESVEAEATVIDQPVVRRREPRKLSFSEYFAGRPINNKSNSKPKNKEKSTSTNSTRQSSKSNDFFLPVGKITIGNKSESDYNPETASETAERIKKVRMKERIYIPDADEDPLPKREAISKSKNKIIVNDQASSIAF